MNIGVNPALMTPRDWLNALTRRVDFGWVRIELLRSYVDGNAPLPEMGSNTREAWQKFQRESRTNWGSLIVESVVNRLIPNGITVDGSNDSKLAKQAQAIWTRNRMAGVFREWVRYGLTFRQSYMTIWLDEDKKALITADSPESMGVSVNPLRPWEVRAAVRWWRDLDLQEDRAIVWGTTSSQQFKRTLLSLNAPTNPPNNMMYYLPVRLLGEWQDAQPVAQTGQPPPVVVYNNPIFCGEFETHIDLINRINREILERLTTSAIQAFRQRAMKAAAGTSGLPQHDANGNVIDWGKIFEPAPGAIWDLPPGIDIWESQPTDITPMLAGCKDDIRQLSAMTSTPFPVLMPDNANQTAEGADAARDAHIFKCGERLAEAKAGVEQAMTLALKAEGADLSPDKGTGDTQDKRVEVIFKPVDRVTIAEMYNAAQAASAAGESWPSIARNILGYSPEQIAQDQLDKLNEAMRAAMFAPNPNVPPEPPTDVGVKFGPVNPNRAIQSAMGKALTAQSNPQQPSNFNPSRTAPGSNPQATAQAAARNPNPRQATNAGGAGKNTQGIGANNPRRK
jgi:uncharacterized protein YfiM (DUF2279 family)